MAYGDVWRLTDHRGRVGLVMEVAPWPRHDPISGVVTAVVLAGEVSYLDRVLGFGATGPFIPEESKTVTRVGRDEW